MKHEKDDPGFDLREVNRRHIHAIDKFYRMFAGAASNLVSYDGAIIGIEARLGVNPRFSDEEMARKLARSWHREPELEGAAGYKVHIYRTHRPTGFAVPAGDLENADIVKAVAAKLRSMAGDYPDVMVGTVTGTFGDGENQPTPHGENHTDKNRNQTEK